MEPPVADAAPDDCQGEQRLSVTFASPNFVGIEAWEESVCSGRVNSYPREFLAPLNPFVDKWHLYPDHENLPIAAIFPTNVTSGFQQYARAACVEEEQRQQRDPEEMPIPLPDCQERIFHEQEREWTIRRGNGRWNVVVKLAGWRGEVVSYRIPVDLPSAVAPSQRPVLVASDPDAMDVLASPNGQAIVQVFPDVIRAQPFGPSSESRSTLVVSKGRSEEIVMVEWATGRFVRRWSQSLKERFGPGNK
jgi:hypothetical protein